MQPRPGDGEAKASPSHARKRKPRITPAEMAPADRRDAAYNAAVRLLAVRERSAVELRTRLAQKGFDRETVIFTLDRLQSSGLQDDVRFAESFAGSAMARDVSSSLIRRKLRQKGVTADLAAQAATEDPDAELERARAAGARRAKALRSIPEDKARARLAAWLARRGFPGDVSAAVVREEFGDPAD